MCLRINYAVKCCREDYMGGLLADNAGRCDISNSRNVLQTAGL